MSESPDDIRILAWAKFLDDYARDWYDIFGDERGSFHSEFWFLLVGCTLAYWRGRPMTVSTACQTMKTGSSSTRESRLKQAVEQGYLRKEKAGADGRSAIVLPTARLEEMMRQQFQRSMDQARSALA